MRFERGTWRGLAVGFALLLCALACAPAARAQQGEWGFWQNGVTEPWWLHPDEFTLAEATGGVERWKRIGEDARRWRADARVGDYFRGSDTHGTYLRWSPGAGFVIANVDKCQARVMGLTYGRVEVTPTLVQFFPEVDKRPAGSHGGHGAEHRAAPRAVLRFVPVEWRRARLLVAEDEMEDFGDYLAGLGRYNGESAILFRDYDFFFSRAGGGGARHVRPVVPPGYERFIKRPVEARVTSVGRTALRRGYVVGEGDAARTYERAAVTPVTIGAGTERGVKEGMVFRVRRPDEGDTVIVLRAGRGSSAGVVVRDVDERGAATYYDHGAARERRHSRVARGWRLTTSLFD